MKQLMTVILIYSISLNVFALTQSDANTDYSQLRHNPNIQTIAEGCMATSVQRATLLRGNPVFNEKDLASVKAHSMLECEYGTEIVKAANCQGSSGNDSCKTIDLKVIYPDDLNQNNTTIKTNNIY